MVKRESKRATDKLKGRQTHLRFKDRQTDIHTERHRQRERETERIKFLYIFI